MSNYDINSNPDLVKHMLEQYKASEERTDKNPDSILPAFKQELLNLGFDFQVLNQAESLLPKYKDTALPVRIAFWIGVEAFYAFIVAVYIWCNSYMLDFRK